jgi:hypothetical protein
MRLAKPVGRPSTRLNETRKALGEDAPWTLGTWAKEPSNGDFEVDWQTEARQVCEAALIAAVDALGI